MTREEQIKAIYEKIWPTRFGWNKYWEFDFVMIWDVLDYIEKNIKLNQIKIHNIKVDNDNLWKEKRKPIEEQSDDCINYIFDLIA